MLSIAQRRATDQYGYRAGMLNVAWLAGVARQVDMKQGCIQQSNNLNAMIPFALADGDFMPAWVRDGVNTKVIARVLSAKTDEGGHVATLRALSFETPTILDMPTRSAWERPVRQGVPVTTELPSDLRPDEPESTDRSMGGRKVADTGNVTWIAGYVAAKFFEPGGQVKPDGTYTTPCLVIALRQTADPADVIPVRLINKLASAYDTVAPVGSAVKIVGSLRMRIKNTSTELAPDGLFPVRRSLYVHCSQLCAVTFARDSREGQYDIREVPEWAKELAEQGRTSSKRQKSAPRPTQAPPDQPPKEPSTASAGATVGSRVLDDDLPLDPALLPRVLTPHVEAPAK